jgi:hypothetical protein
LSEKPHLSGEHKQGHKEWCKKEKARLGEYGRKLYVCFLDEKWFYTTSRHPKVKYLPPVPTEIQKKVRPVIPTTVSRRHTINVMFLGVFAKPIKEHGFDGKIFIERVFQQTF